MAVVGECQKFCCRQCRTGGQNPLNGGIIGAIHEQNRSVHGVAGSKLIHEESRFPVSDADGSEYQGERFSAYSILDQDSRLGGDLCSQFIGWQTRSREDG